MPDKRNRGVGEARSRTVRWTIVLGVRVGGKSGRGTVRASDVVGWDNVRWRGGGVGEWVARGGLTCKSRVMQRSWQMERRTNGWTGRGASASGTAVVA
jgi:hypothetical protein